MRFVFFFISTIALLSTSCGVKTGLITYEQYEADERRKAASPPSPPPETEKRK